MRWSVAIRTLVIDDLVRSVIAVGADTVLSLGAGLAARPYRPDLPDSLRWVEVDHPSLIEGKERQLRDERPTCRVERIGLDLAERDARRELFGRIGASSEHALVLTEGLLPYLSVDDAAALADDLRGDATFVSWASRISCSRT